MSQQIIKKSKKVKRPIEFIIVDDDDDDSSEYMNELMTCCVCKRDDIPRKSLHWNEYGSFTMICEECFQKTDCVKQFISKYPRTADMVTGLNPNYPIELKIKITIAVSELMAKLDRGDYKSYQKNHKKLPDEVIDMFGKTYIQNYSKLADKVYETIGHYNTFPKIVSLQPDNFIDLLISQFC
jgi:hypothetical protein